MAQSAVRNDNPYDVDRVELDRKPLRDEDCEGMPSFDNTTASEEVVFWGLCFVVLCLSVAVFLKYEIGGF